MLSLVVFEPGREKGGGPNMFRTWAGKKWGPKYGQNLGGKKVGAQKWEIPGREKSGGGDGSSKRKESKYWWEPAHYRKENKGSTDSILRHVQYIVSASYSARV